MGWPDILIIVIIGVSTLISLLRGFVREALSLAAWVVAFIVALSFANPLSSYASFLSDSEVVQVIATFIVLFVATLVAAAVANHLIYQLVKQTGLGGTDRVAGMVFGLVRGYAVVALLVLVGSLSGMQGERWWMDSHLIGAVEPAAEWMQRFMPLEIEG